MNIQRLAEFIEAKKVVATSKHTITIGCASIHRDIVEQQKYIAKQCVGYHAAYCYEHGEPILFSVAECDYLLNLMDSFQEPVKEQAKFKVGDWVRCKLPEHVGKNPFQISRLDRNTVYGAYPEDGSIDHCVIRNLELVHPPAKRFDEKHWDVVSGDLDSYPHLSVVLLELRAAVEEIFARLEKK